MFGSRSREKVKKYTKVSFSEVHTVPKCCKKHYEIKIFVVRDHKKTWEIMKTKIRYEQKHGKTQGKLMNFKDRSREKVKKLINKKVFPEVPTA